MPKTTRRANMVSVLFVLMALGIVLTAWSGRAAAQVRPGQATLTIVVGRVEAMRTGTTTWVLGTVGMQLTPGDQIRALERSEAEMQLTDGSVIKLAPGTRLQVSRLDADPTTGGRDSSFHLLIGTVRAVVAQAATMLVAARQRGFVVTTPTAVAAARGSDGVITYAPETKATTVLSFSGVWAALEPTTGRLVLVVQGTLVRTEPGRQGNPQPVPASFQVAILTNLVIRTPTPVGVTTAPVTPGTLAAPLQAPTLPLLTLNDLQALIPPVPAPGAPLPPLNQTPVLVPGIVPESPLPRTTLSEAELRAVLTALNDPQALQQAPPPPETRIAQATGAAPPPGVAPLLPITPPRQRIERPISPSE